MGTLAPSFSVPLGPDFMALHDQCWQRAGRMHQGRPMMLVQRNVIIMLDEILEEYFAISHRPGSSEFFPLGLQSRRGLRGIDP